MTDSTRAEPIDGEPGSGSGDGRRSARRRLVLAVVGALVAVGLVVAIAVGLDRRDGTEAAPAPSASATTDPTPAASATPTPAASPAPTPAASATPTPTPDAPVSTTAPPAPSTPPAPQPAGPTGQPERVAPQHGDDLWGVYLAVLESFDGPTDTAVDDRLAALGYEPAGGGELACDQGAPESLGLDPRTIASSVYFASEADARRFVELYGPDVVGVAPVTTLCLD